MNKVSGDLPEYFKTRYSVNNPAPPKTSHKQLRTPLTQGISNDSPDFFRVAQVPIITSTSRKILLTPEAARFQYDLKKYQVTTAKHFNYCDMQDSHFDYDSLSLVNRVTLIADRNPRLKRSGGFAKIYEKSLEKGFGITRGEFSVERMNDKVLRTHPAKARNLEELIRKTSRKRIGSREVKTPNGKRMVPEVSIVLKSRVKRCPSRELEDLDKFESSFHQCYGLAENRAMYKIDKTDI